jgi:hypothetical protein
LTELSRTDPLAMRLSNLAGADIASNPLAEPKAALALIRRVVERITDIAVPARKQVGE